MLDIRASISETSMPNSLARKNANSWSGLFAKSVCFLRFNFGMQARYFCYLLHEITEDAAGQSDCHVPGVSLRDSRLHKGVRQDELLAFLSIAQVMHTDRFSPRQGADPDKTYSGKLIIRLRELRPCQIP